MVKPTRAFCPAVFLGPDTAKSATADDIDAVHQLLYLGNITKKFLQVLLQIEARYLASQRQRTVIKTNAYLAKDKTISALIHSTSYGSHHVVLCILLTLSASRSLNIHQNTSCI